MLLEGIYDLFDNGAFDAASNSLSSAIYESNPLGINRLWAIKLTLHSTVSLSNCVPLRN